MVPFQNIVYCKTNTQHCSELSRCSVNLFLLKDSSTGQHVTLLSGFVCFLVGTGVSALLENTFVKIGSPEG